MPPVNVQQAFELARQHHQAGRLPEAEKLYRQVLAIQPAHAEALHLLGVVAHQVGHHTLAVEWISKAIALGFENAAAYSNLGEASRALGRHDEAIAFYRRAIELDPNYAEARNNLGTALAQRGHFEESASAFRQAIKLKPAYAEAHKNLGAALEMIGRDDEAIAAYRRALELNPSSALSHYVLANAIRAQGLVDEAIRFYRRAVELKPDFAEAHNNLGVALADKGEFDAAIGVYLGVLEIAPDLLQVHNNLGNALRMKGQINDAIVVLRRGLALNEACAELHNNLGIAQAAAGKIDEAVASYRRAIGLEPGYAEAHNNLGNALREQGFLDEAIASHRLAIELRVDYADAYTNLGNTLKDQGLIAESEAAYREAIRLNPDAVWPYSNLLFALLFIPDRNEEMIAGEHQRWNRQFSEPAKRFHLPHRISTDPDRRLRIGYLSPDFRDHVVGRNLLPLIRYHDSREFDIFCYSGVFRPDRLTEEFRSYAAEWRATAGLADEALADIIRKDGIDILVDLTQHMAGNRLPVFARKPAPVQVSFAGYPETTGLAAIEYRISDRWLESGADPGSRVQVAGCEMTPESSPVNHPPSCVLRPASGLFLLDSFWCYDPCGMEVAVNELPAAANGHVTFGSLNNFSKVNDFVLELWARVLTQVKDSRLFLLSGFGSHRQQTIDFLAQHGVQPDKVEFVAPSPRKDYLELYHRLDIALDPFPYGGHTTSLDALWMGLPVVSLAGDRPVSRAGLSILNNLGLPDLVTFSGDDYVKIAANLANDLPRLAELRRTLRTRMEHSVLMNAPHFARQIEAAYRAMWREWCAKQEAPAAPTGSPRS